MIRVFADASVLIAGAASRTGASRAVLVLAEIGLIKLVVCKQVLDEAERNLRKKRPEALPYFATLLASIDVEVLPDPAPEQAAAWHAVIEPKDAPILAAAASASIDRLLSLDVKDFVQPHVMQASGLIIETPATFVQNLRGLMSAGLRSSGQ